MNIHFTPEPWPREKKSPFLNRGGYLDHSFACDLVSDRAAALV